MIRELFVLGPFDGFDLDAHVATAAVGIDVLDRGCKIDDIQTLEFGVGDGDVFADIVFDILDTEGEEELDFKVTKSKLTLSFVR